MQPSAFLLGVEGDIDWSSIHGSVTPANGFCNLAVSFTAVGSTCESKNNWLGTARIRLGYVVNRVLVYATGGAAFGDVQTGLTGSGLAGASAAGGSFQHSVQFGWTAGAGVEVAFMENWTAKFEYLFVNLGSATCNVRLAAARTVSASRGSPRPMIALSSPQTWCVPESTINSGRGNFRRLSATAGVLGYSLADAKSWRSYAA